MEKRYQVFVSSTFEDMPIERQAVMQTILRLYCFPFGMELFPASNDGSWELIERIIDDSDYYIVVVRGRYGSIHPEDGISYTEKEYRYARSKRIPVLPFLYRDPGALRVNESEANQDSKQKLQEFRNLLKSEHHCREWSTAQELQLEVFTGLAELKLTHPREGWVKGRNAMSVESMKELEELRKFASEHNLSNTFDEFSQGSDLAKIKYMYKPIDNPLAEWLPRETEVTWDRIYEHVAAAIYSDYAGMSIDMNEAKNAIFRAIAKPDYENALRGPCGEHDVVIPTKVAEQCMVQLEAIGLIISLPVEQKYSLHDRPERRWVFTEIGRRRHIALRAIRRTPPPKE